MTTKTKTHKTAPAKKTRSRKAAAVKDQLAGLTLLGEIITWNARSDSSHTHTDVVKALDTASLDTDIARELLPRHAFARACRKMQDDRLIEAVNETGDVIVFQVTRKFLAQEELHYQRETFLRLNKTTGKIECDDAQLASRMQERLDLATEERTTNDITKIVQRLFDVNADLFPIRDQGGVYFVPAEHSAFVVCIENFLTALGGVVGRWPVPAGTQHGNTSVQDTIGGAMSALIQEHNQAVAAFTLHTRPDTIEAAAEKIKATRVKIEAYANYLQDRSAGLLAEVDAANAKLIEQVQAITTERASMPATTKDGSLVFGHPVTAVIRWMGKENWTTDEARKALDGLGVSTAEATIKTQLGAGRSGKRGEPANLSREQVDALTKAAGL